MSTAIQYSVIGGDDQGRHLLPIHARASRHSLIGAYVGPEASS